ncbi:hypothetical protein [uncultured Aquimarina sp.]|uniref:hypothetical protein n=1 Tax=uncultured Aquimarina sp. TaxID=575652 RepID=UPI00262AFF8D|nr:hypothetical protein [uncultured Aquimarina sp.]
MSALTLVKESLFYREINTLMREQFPLIKGAIVPVYEQILEENEFHHPLRIEHYFEHAAWEANRQWRLELDFDDYQWSNRTIKPHFLTALISIEIGKEVIHFKYQLCSSFNEELQPMETEKIELNTLNNDNIVIEKVAELKQFLEHLPKAFLKEIEQIDFNELEYTMHPKIQEKWKQGYLPGYDAIIMGEGDIIMANAYSTYNPNNGETKRYWSPTCDTTLESLEKYNDDIWVEYDIFHGAFEYQNQQFVFGDGGMGNEGFIASTSLSGILNWAIFFTFSNPICKAEIKNEHLICYGDSGIIITIDLKNITKIKIELSTD